MLHRVQMVSPGADKTRWPSLNISGAMVVLPTWQYLTPWECQGGPAICFLMVGLFFSDCFHSEGSSRSDLMVAVQFLWPTLWNLSFGTQRWPISTCDKVAETLKSHSALRVFKSHSPCVIQAVIFFSGCKCHAVKLELSTLSKVLPKE